MHIASSNIDEASSRSNQFVVVDFMVVFAEYGTVRYTFWWTVLRCA
jgi:hypothetical protein